MCTTKSVFLSDNISTVAWAWAWRTSPGSCLSTVVVLQKFSRLNTGNVVVVPGSVCTITRLVSVCSGCLLLLVGGPPQLLSVTGRGYR